MPTVKSKTSMVCNKPHKSWKPAKKRVVKACSGGKEKIIHFGASGYGNNYSDLARKSFRARHKCDTANDKLTARYWSCKNLWSKQSDITPCPKNRKCKSQRRSPRKSQRKSQRRSPRKSQRKSPRKSVKKSRKKRKSPLVKSRRRSVKKSTRRSKRK